MRAVVSSTTSRSSSPNESYMCKKLIGRSNKSCLAFDKWSKLLQQIVAWWL